jgi:hypothetical protein
MAQISGIKFSATKKVKYEKIYDHNGGFFADGGIDKRPGNNKKQYKPYDRQDEQIHFNPKN